MKITLNKFSIVIEGQILNEEKVTGLTLWNHPRDHQEDESSGTS